MVASSPDELAANSRRQKLEQEMHKGYKAESHPLPNGPGSSAELQAVQLATDVKSLIQWLNHDILALAGPPWAERQKLFDFIVEELSRRDPTCTSFVLCG